MKDRKKFDKPIVDSDMITELSEKLIIANERLIEEEQKRKKMLENISHDLRAPLTAVRSTIDYLLQKEDLSKEDVLKYINILDSRSKALEVMVDDLYFLTCIESGKEYFYYKKIPIVQLLEEFFFETELDVKYKKNKLILDIQKGMNEYVNADANKLYRVLDNLFSNASKYAGEGASITLGAYTNKGDICIFVEDNGNGISKDNIPYIFDRTYRVSSERSPQVKEGSGLGLSIAKSIISQHGGKISCESDLGEGARFIISLPRAN